MVPYESAHRWGVEKPDGVQERSGSGPTRANRYVNRLSLSTPHRCTRARGIDANRSALTASAALICDPSPYGWGNFTALGVAGRGLASCATTDATARSMITCASALSREWDSAS